MGTWTEAMLMSRIRSALRRIWSYYKPRVEAKNRVKKTVKGKRHKFEYKCSACKKYFKSKTIRYQLDPSSLSMTFHPFATGCFVKIQMATQ
jgi:hypothetical protein